MSHLKREKYNEKAFFIIKQMNNQKDKLLYKNIKSWYEE